MNNMIKIKKKINKKLDKLRNWIKIKIKLI